MPAETPPIRVVIRLPYNRPEKPLPDPPVVEWTGEKENILWEVIARSRAADSGGTDWKGLAAHLDVPLPYLLFRAQARYEEDLRGLQGIRGPVNPFAGPSAAKPGELFPAINDTPTAPRRLSGGLANSVRMASSTRQQTPLGVRGRLNSLGGPKKATSSSTLTLRAPLRKPRAALEPPSPSSSGSGESDTDEEATKAERAEKEHEMQEDLERKLQNLQLLMTNEALGFVRSAPRTGGSSILNGSKGKGLDRGRAAVPAYGTTSTRTPLSDSLRLGGLGLTPLATQQRPGPESTRSQSVSSASSPQGSIPSIPSPQSESQRTSPISIARPAKSSSPPALSPRSSRSVRYQALVGRTNISEQGSNHGSSASSFSDISDMSLSSSALESALSSNIRSGGSRISNFTRSRFSGRGGRA